jgi:hypothetical protein
MKKLLLVIGLLFLLASPVHATVEATAQTISFACNGHLATFAFTFSVGDPSEIQVLLTNSAGVTTTLTPTTQYTASCTPIDWDSNLNAIDWDCSTGGSITTVATYASGNTITIQTNIPLTQESSFTENMPALYKTFEAGLDKLTRIDKQLAAEIGGAYYQYVENQGTALTQRLKLNLIPGTNISLAFSDNPTNNSTDVTITSSGGGGGGGMVYPSAGIPISTNAAWSTSITETDGDVIYGTGGIWTKSNAPALSAENMTSIPSPSNIVVTLPTTNGQYTGGGSSAKSWTVDQNVTIGQICYETSDGNMTLAQGNAYASTKGKLALSLGSIASGQAGNMLEQGYVYNAGWNLSPLGADVYISEVTAGALTLTPPASGNFLRIVGTVISSHVIEFKPDHTTVKVQ